MYKKGRLTTWNDKKGFGFITPVYGGKQIFIHITGFYYHNKRPEINQLVTYVISQDNKGRTRAIEAAFYETANNNIKEKNGKLSYIISAMFILFVGLSVLFTDMLSIVFFYYIGLSLWTFALYAIDKSAAKNGRLRISENSLQLFSLLGGWPGALIAQVKFRHKTRKASFLGSFWIMTLINCGFFIWLLTPKGSIFLGSLLRYVEEMVIF